MAARLSAAPDTMATEPNNTRNEKMGEPDLSPTAQAIRLERLEGRQNSLEQMVRSSNESLRDAVESLSNRLERWFDDYEKNRDSWRVRHEAENENAYRSLNKELNASRSRHEQELRAARAELDKEVRQVREGVIRIFAVGMAITMLAGVIVSGFLWGLNLQFQVVADKVNRGEAASAYNRALLDKQASDINDLKLYLARGGRIPEEPYVPPSQREKGNED